MKKREEKEGSKEIILFVKYDLVEDNSVLFYWSINSPNPTPSPSHHPPILFFSHLPLSEGGVAALRVLECSQGFGVAPRVLE